MPDSHKKIVFMGTPDFSAAHLEAIVKAGWNVVGVFSQPDKVSGRGGAIRPTAVKKMALKYSIPVFQPKSVNIKLGFEQLKALDPDIIVVVAYGKILKKQVIELPKTGIFNVHASLLPKYRGAAPIQRAIENGEKQTGITIMKIGEELDAGDIALQQAVDIESCDHLEKVYDKLEKAGIQLLTDFLDRLISSQVQFVQQDHEQATYAAKIEKEELLIDWTKNASAVHNKIRAFDPTPSTRTYFKNALVKIKSSEGFFEGQSGKEPGTICSIEKKGALIQCGQGQVLVKEIQLPSKKFITFMEAKNGRKIEEGERFTNE